LGTFTKDREYFLKRSKNMYSLTNMKDFESWKEDSLRDTIHFGDELLEVSTHLIISYDKEDKLYNAHSLEFDIVAEGKTRNKAIKEVLQAILSHITFCIAYENNDKIISPAPDEYWKEFYEGIKSGSVIEKSKIPKLNADSQLPYRPSRFNQICVMGV
jgi:hypothetical protein